MAKKILMGSQKVEENRKAQVEIVRRCRENDLRLLRDPMASWGIEPATFRLAAQCLS
jgi:hypothetical protein